MLTGLKNLLEKLSRTSQPGVSDPRHDVTVELHGQTQAMLENLERRVQLIENNLSPARGRAGGVGLDGQASSGGQGIDVGSGK